MNQYYYDNLELLKENPKIWNSLISQDLKNDVEFIKLALNQDGLLLELIDNSLITADLCLIAISNNFHAVYFIPQALYRTHDIFEQTLFQWLLIDPRKKSLIRSLSNNDDQKISEILGEIKPELLKVFKNPSNELIKKSLTKNGLLLEYIPAKSQSEENVWIALKQNYYALRYAHTPTEAQMMYSLKKDSSLIKCIVEPTIKVCKYAIKNDPDNFYHLHNPCEELIDFALKLDPSIISVLERNKKTPEICLRAVCRDPFVLEHVDDQSLELVFKALSKEKRVRVFVNQKYRPEHTKSFNDDDFYKFIKSEFVKSKIIMKHL